MTSDRDQLAALAVRQVDPARARELTARLDAAVPPARLERLRAACRTWAPRTAAYLGLAVSAVLVTGAPAQAAQTALAPANAVSVSASPSVNLDDLLEELSGELADLLDLLGTDRVDVSLDDLAKYLNYSFASASSDFMRIPDADDDPLADPDGRPLSGAQYVQQALGSPRAWYGALKRLGHEPTFPKVRVPLDEDDIDQALAAGDVDEFRVRLFSSLGRTHSVDQRNLARALAVALDGYRPDMRYMWLDLIEQTRKGSPPPPPPSASAANTMMARFIEFRERRREGQPELAGESVNAAMLDAFVRRACAQEYAERLSEQIRVLSALRAQKVTIARGPLSGRARTR